MKKHEKQLRVHSGDWTDYWNFGSGSAAKEGKLNRRTKQGMKAVELIEAFHRQEDPSYMQLKKQAWEQIHLYDEHTWGVFNAISEPDHLNVDIQWMHKAHYAYQANSLTGYLLGTQMEILANNPLQSEEPEGILLVNPSSVPITHDIRVHSSFIAKGKHLSADRMRQVLMNNERNHTGVSYGTVELAPFSWRKIPYLTMQEAELSTDIHAHSGIIKAAGGGPWFREVTTEAGRIETPFHICSFDPSTGRITSLYDKQQDWELLDLTSPWSLFQYVQETVDSNYHPNNRSAIFPRDVEKGNNGISVWNHDWKAKRQTYSRMKSCQVERGALSATLIICWEAPGVDNLEQRFTFFSYRAEIEMTASFQKQDITTPEGTYFAIPLNVREWQCHYDTAGQFVELDAQQLPGVCRDYLTVDKSVSVYDGLHGVTLVCPDAPLVQVGDFNFGKEQESVPRHENPLLLAWPMNNYWDTNFRARQPGFVSFTYVLSTFSSFDPADVMQSAIQAVSPILTTPVIDCKIVTSGQFIQISGKGVQLFDVKPAEEGKGIIVRLSNCMDQVVDAQLHFPNVKIEAAYRTNALEEIQYELTGIQESSLELSLEAKQMLHILVIFES